ncbi:bifunctional phosphoribosyl-AMP cyclohydrolase/phosphoribosyl-ATP diphosphatase HisIE [Candidatus Pantoea carbekii]|uniref:Histidine biosynthesis bifunctional protein HisIE n=1 Tax=Candidatus Pantoea carbekii TaxID=1235990 RepID=U3U311_9GAMM|nr:bifunctional phosphoribosyl-AMP cyclohydrolase/phosphoribosyl-ATP diphosphatase HisIE [Candidatus Pantoea carbekii]AKC32018.1 bifunctional phosphoribosyl-AMP cyclohydrolase_phosphoribosyl-ATP pyrophosphatase [Candidatus Pantoea carbekii]BAO00541.1 HisI protein [Candidatus Pantoea carbekii]
MLTEEQLDKLDWDKTSGMMPVIIQNNISGEVLMHGYMNKDALQKTLQEGYVTFFSRTKNRLWTKGEISSHFLEIVSVSPDCDYDTLLILTNPVGPTCHLGLSSCFSTVAPKWTFLYQLELLIAKRKNFDKESSYTTKLYASGIKRIAQKVGEEGIETALAAMTNDRRELIDEASDLMYHLLVLLQSREVDFSSIIDNLLMRHNASTYDYK